MTSLLGFSFILDSSVCGSLSLPLSLSMCVYIEMLVFYSIRRHIHTHSVLIWTKNPARTQNKFMVRIYRPKLPETYYKIQKNTQNRFQSKIANKSVRFQHIPREYHTVSQKVTIFPENFKVLNFRNGHKTTKIWMTEKKSERPKRFKIYGDLSKPNSQIQSEVRTTYKLNSECSGSDQTIRIGL